MSYLCGNNVDTTDDFFVSSSLLHNSVWNYSYHSSQTKYSFLSHLKRHNIHCVYLSYQGNQRQTTFGIVMFLQAVKLSVKYNRNHTLN
jgi:hypothetical protein